MEDEEEMEVSDDEAPAPVQPPKFEPHMPIKVRTDYVPKGKCCLERSVDIKVLHVSNSSFLPLYSSCSCCRRQGTYANLSEM